jgi:hypothetical protein
VFVVDEAMKGIPRSEGNRIVSVFRSINEPKVAAAERPAEPTRAYLCEFDGEPTGSEVRVVLCFAKSGARLVYVPEDGARGADRNGLESDALDFVESMGFLMDNMNLAKMKPEDRKAALAALPVFEEERLEISDGVFDAPIAVSAGAGSEDSVSLSDLEEEFLRDEGEMVDVDSALDSLLEPGNQAGRSLPGPDPGTTGEGVDGKWKTIVRFLASF